MITVVNEPQAEYKVASWQTRIKDFPIDEYICRIENETVFFVQPSGYAFMVSSEKPKRKLSALRGKLSKQSNNEVNDQISDLRGEWNRNI